MVVRCRALGQYIREIAVTHFMAMRHAKFLQSNQINVYASVASQPSDKPMKQHALANKTELTPSAWHPRHQSDIRNVLATVCVVHGSQPRCTTK